MRCNLKNNNEHATSSQFPPTLWTGRHAKDYLLEVTAQPWASGVHYCLFCFNSNTLFSELSMVNFTDKYDIDKQNQSSIILHLLDLASCKESFVLFLKAKIMAI